MRSKRILTLLLCLLLTAAVILVPGCGKKGASSGADGEATVLGEGEKVFELTVTDLDGNSEKFEIHTDKATVGEALTELDLIEGEEGEFGLYVKTVNGIDADYNKDGTYWAFYINGEYASSGVDMTDIFEGDSYELKVEKA